MAMRSRMIIVRDRRATATTLTPNDHEQRRRLLAGGAP